MKATKENDASGIDITKVVIRITLSVLILSGGAIGCLYLKKTKPPKRGRPKHAVQAAVEVAEVLRHDRGIEFETDGVVVPFREISIAAEVSGRIVFKSPNCRNGRYVRKGELLVRIDPTDYQLEVQRIQQELKQAENSIIETDVAIETTEEQITIARETLENWQREIKRYEGIDDPGVFSQSEVDSVRRNEITARKALQSLESQLRLSRAQRDRVVSGRDLKETQLERANVNLQRVEITAPIDGVITRYTVEQDGYAKLGSEIAAVQDTATLDVQTKLMMEQVYWLWLSQEDVATELSVSESPVLELSASELSVSELQKTLSATTDAYRLPKVPVSVVYQLGGTEYSWAGTLQHYDGAGIDPRTRMLPCRVVVEDPTACTSRVIGSDPSGYADSDDNGNETPVDTNDMPTLLSGMYVQVRIHAKPQIELLRIPESALIPGDVVWAPRDGKLTRHAVDVAYATDHDVLIYKTDVSTLNETDQVVTSPIAAPIEGMPVIVVDPNAKVDAEVKAKAKVETERAL